MCEHLPKHAGHILGASACTSLGYLQYIFIISRVDTTSLLSTLYALVHKNNTQVSSFSAILTLVPRLYKVMLIELTVIIALVHNLTQPTNQPTNQSQCTR